MTPAPPRSRAERRRDVEARLAHDVDVWVATACADGTPHLVPLSFAWNGSSLVVATSAGSLTGENLARSPRVRLALGALRDVVMIDGIVERVLDGTLPAQDADRFVARAGFDPRRAPEPYPWFRVTPMRIQAWREVNEMPDREMMRGGHWLD